MSEEAGIAKGIGSEIEEEAEGVGETLLHAGTAVYDGATGDWDGAADSALSMSESALGVATGGISTAAEAGWDVGAKATGQLSAHDELKDLAQGAGNAIGDGLTSLVGDEQAHKSVVAFDDGHLLDGLADMAEGAARTIGSAVEHGASSVGQAISDATGSDATGSAEPAAEYAYQPIDQPDQPIE